MSRNKVVIANKIKYGNLRKENVYVNLKKDMELIGVIVKAIKFLMKN